MKRLLIFGLLLVGSISSAQAPAKVYICTGQYATSYHKTSDCKGLGNCKADIKSITMQEAQRLNRKPCRICY